MKDTLAGEDSNKFNAFIIIGFGSNYILLLLGRSSIGKNLLVDTIIVLVPHYRRNRWTTHVPSYLDPEEVKDKVLYIRELPGIEEELGNFLKAIEEVDGRILFSTDCVKRNPITGELEVETHKVPVKAFISTSNREDVHIPGLMERTFLIRMDDSIEQDRRVAEYVDKINKQSEEIKLGLRKWTDQEWSLARVFNRIRERMGIKRHEGRVKRFVITPHGLRKFFRTQMARGGANEMAIEYMMGHRTGAYMRVEALGEEWLRDQYLRGRLKLRRWRPSREETLRLLREQLRNLGYSEEEMDEFIRSAMTLIQAGYNIEEIIYLKT